jgi:hypothetical protein
VAVDARGRDLFTGSDGTATVLAQARVELTAAYLDPSILSVVSDPPVPGLEVLVGTSPLGGFRRTVGELMPADRRSHSVRFRLFSDLPAAYLRSGRALRVAGVPLPKSGMGGPPVDICAGWVAGGTAIRGLTEFGPPLHIGPQASAVGPEDDPVAWHEVAPLAVQASRRRRRLDLWEADGTTFVECHFRDSHMGPDGRETVVHEYAVHAGIDPDRRIVWCRADPGPLPFPECPGAVASAGRLAGVRIDDVARQVQEAFSGPSTCTHLNDTLRAMGDVAALLDEVRQRVAGAV